MPRPTAALLGTLFLTPPLLTQTPTVLLDIDKRETAEFHSDPGGYVRLGGLVLFAATEPGSGSELWRLDLASGAVAQVADIAPGLASSFPGYLTVLGGHVYFAADDGVHGRELWRSDGTTAGTTLVRDIEAGASTSSLREFVRLGNELFFSAAGGSGFELWKTDGTTAGTVQVIDLEPGVTGSFPSAFTVFGGELWFAATTSATGNEAWRSDGTAAGTVLVADLAAGSAGSFPRHFVPHGGAMLFGAGTALWRSDGTPTGTTAIESQNPSAMVSDGTRVFYTVSTSLFVSDGTAGNAQLVTTLGGAPFATVSDLTPLGAGIVFRYSSTFPNTTFALWSSDGTGAGTVQIHAGLAPVAAAARLGSDLMFTASGGNGGELWRTDGTPAGTSEVADIAPGSASSLPLGLVEIEGAGFVMFSADDGDHGREPWRSDGTTAGTVLVANVANASGMTQSSNAADFVDAAGITYFSASEDGTGATLWRTDGTPAGTFAVVPPGPDRPLGIQKLTAFGTKVVFVARHPTLGNEPWVSDGTTAGTHVLRDSNPLGDSNPGYFTLAGDYLYYDAFGNFGRVLWRSDGTTAGTVRLLDGAFNNIGSRGALGRGIVFSRYLVGFGWEPWYSDGTFAGTIQLAEIAPGAATADPENMVELGGRCYFTALNHTVFYVTDGTPAGTEPFLDLMPGTDDYYDDLRVVGDTLYFSARSPIDGLELWKSDGTVQGSQLVLDASPGTAGTLIIPAGTLGNLLLYTAATSGSPIRQLWRSDGTAAGTFPILDQQVFGIFAAGDGHVWFAGQDAGGVELWSTDGTAAGTGLFAELHPGEVSSQPADFAASTGRLLFAAAHPALGREPWVLPLGATAQPVGHACVASHRLPRLEGDPPVLGTTFGLRVRQGPTLGFGVMLASLHTTSSFRLPGGRCDLFLDPGFVVLAIAGLNGGGFDVPWTLPADPAFAGLPLRAQSLLFPNGGLTDVEATNAVSLVTGL